MSLLRAMQLMMAQQVAAPSGLQVVEALNTSAIGYNAATITLTDLRVGDQVVVLGSMQSGAYDWIFSDGQSNTYTMAPLATLNGYYQRAAITTITSAASSLVVTGKLASGNGTKYLFVYHIRGATLSIDTANVGSQTLSYPNLQPANFYVNSSARAFVLTIMQTSLSGSRAGNTLIVDSTPPRTDDLANGGNFGQFLYSHMLVQAAMVNQLIAFHSSDATNNNTKDYLYCAPFTY